MVVTESARGGGAISRGIVRDGETVLRPQGAWTPAVHHHLRRLRHARISVPEPIGIDGEYEILRYIDGKAMWTPGERSYLNPPDIVELGPLLRR